MTDFDDLHNQLLLNNIVDDSIVACSGAIDLSVREFFASGTAWGLTQFTKFFENPLDVCFGERPEVFSDRAFKPQFISCHDA